MTPQELSNTDLPKLFSAVTRALKKQQESLNAADGLNHNHGDNMVKNFQVITSAVRKKKDSRPAEQLQFASQALAQRAQSGSAQVYSQGLAQAANRLEGQSAITPENALVLIQALLGGNAPGAQPGGGQSDAVSNVLDGLFGGGGQTQPGSEPAQAGFDMGMLLNAGISFMQARQQGAAPVDALVQAVMSGSQMNNTTHRSQSGQLVAGTLLNKLGSLLGGSRR